MAEVKIPPMPISVRRILDEVAADHGVSVLAMVGPLVRRRLTRARYDWYSRIVARIVINGAPPSLPQIGRWANRDHTSVLYGLRRHVSGFEWNQYQARIKGCGRPKGEMYSRIKLAAMLQRQAQEARAA